MKAILLFLKGFIMGIANIIPGVSGGTLAIILGIYEKLINILSAFWKNIKESIKFLLPLLLGLGVAIIAGSFAVDWGLENFPIATTMFFIGLVLGGIPFIYIKVHKKYSFLNVSIFIIVVAIVLLISLLAFDRNVSLDNLNFLLIIRLFFVGMIAAATMIIPGISGSLVLMNIGYYESIIDALKGLTKLSTMGHSICVLLPFGIGVLVGLFLIARLIKLLLSKFPVQSYFAILAFIIASIVCIIIKMDTSNFKVSELILGILLMCVGAFITFIMGKYDYNRSNTEETENKIETEENETLEENKGVE